MLEADTGQAQSHSRASDRYRRQTADRSEITNYRQMEGPGEKVENSNLGSLLLEVIQENIFHIHTLFWNEIFIFGISRVIFGVLTGSFYCSYSLQRVSAACKVKGWQGLHMHTVTRSQFSVTLLQSWTWEQAWRGSRNQFWVLP